MNALVWVAVATLGVAPYLYRGWKHGEALLSERSAYGIARAESREGSHLDLAFDAADDEVACLNCGAANEAAFAFCRRCETPL
jgi:ribosomal protein L40E